MTPHAKEKTCSAMIAGAALSRFGILLLMTCSALLLPVPVAVQPSSAAQRQHDHPLLGNDGRSSGDPCALRGGRPSAQRKSHGTTEGHQATQGEGHPRWLSALEMFTAEAQQELDRWVAGQLAPE